PIAVLHRPGCPGVRVRVRRSRRGARVDIRSDWRSFAGPGPDPIRSVRHRSPHLRAADTRRSQAEPPVRVRPLHLAGRLADPCAGFEPGGPADAETHLLARSARRRDLQTASTRRKAPSRRRAPAPAAGSARPDPRDRRILELERENRSLAQSLAELQERVSTLLGIPLEPDAKS